MSESWLRTGRWNLSDSAFSAQTTPLVYPGTKARSPMREAVPSCHTRLVAYLWLYLPWKADFEQGDASRAGILKWKQWEAYPVVSHTVRTTATAMGLGFDEIIMSSKLPHCESHGTGKAAAGVTITMI